MREVFSGDRAGSIARSRATMRAVVALERLWPLVLPALLVVALFLSLSWLGVFRLLPDTARLGLLAVLGVAFLVSLYPLRFFRRPLPAEIDRRIEAANRLRHTPLQVQSDRLRPAGDAFSDALWREHRRRMAARLERLGGDLPRTGVPETGD